MNRKSILVVVLLSCLLTSCMKYQYMTVKSDLPKTQRGYVIENDSFAITYSFAGAHCPVQIEIENKSSLPVYVDWSRSALVVNNKTYSWVSYSTLSATATGISTKVGSGVSFENAEINGVITTASSSGFVPPHSYLQNIPITVAKKQIKIRTSNTFSVQSSNTKVTVRRKDYRKEESPINIRSYLTLSQNSDMKEAQTFDNHFWLGTIYQSDISLNKCNCFADAATTFSVSRVTGTGHFFLGTAIVGLVVLNAALETPDNNDN
jgi:uncharacterized membrane protein YjfL (UPF0719 family)